MSGCPPDPAGNIVFDSEMFYIKLFSILVGSLEGRHALFRCHANVTSNFPQ
jgi:hypothetical protein